MDLSMNGERSDDIPGSNVSGVLVKIRDEGLFYFAKNQSLVNRSESPLSDARANSPVSDGQPVSPATDQSPGSVESSSLASDTHVDSPSTDNRADSPSSDNRADSPTSYDCFRSQFMESRAISSASVSRDGSPGVDVTVVGPRTSETPVDTASPKRSKLQTSPLPSSSRVLRFKSPPDDGVQLVSGWTCEKEGSSNNEESEQQQQVAKSKRKSSKPRKLKITIKRDSETTAEITGFQIDDQNVLVKIEEDSMAEDPFTTDRDDSDEDYRLYGRRKRPNRGKRKKVKKPRTKATTPTVKKKKILKGSGEQNAKQKKKRRDIAVSSCKVCGRTFRNFYMATHMRTHTGEKPYACSQCDKHFSTECYLKMHRQSCHEDPQAFQCDICHRNLASKGSLREHKRTHSDERPFQCHICQKVFRQPALLINHIKTHSDLTPYQCELCGNRYKYKRSMEMHKERIHDGIRKSFPCTMCGKVFTRKTKLKDHTNWHLGKSPHLCEHCGKRFLSRKTLRTHLLIHEDKKPYPCDVCGKAFRQAHVLKRHTTTHTGIKPFRCDACGKQFIHRVYLVRHDCPQAKNKLLETVVDVGGLPVVQQVPQGFGPVPEVNII